MFAFKSGRDYNKAMYLVSLYFDEKTNKKIQSYMECVAKSSGNSYMPDKKIPPHITLTAFESRADVACLVEVLDKVISEQKPGLLHWVSVGAFFPKVLYLTPVLNEYLHNLSAHVCTELTSCNDTEIQFCYRPFGWLPHTTIGKTLSETQMRAAFEGVQKSFSPFEGTVVKVGLSKATPKEELKSWDL